LLAARIDGLDPGRLETLVGANHSLPSAGNPNGG
jgi:hypothetical protein